MTGDHHPSLSSKDHRERRFGQLTAQVHRGFEDLDGRIERNGRYFDGNIGSLEGGMQKRVSVGMKVQRAHSAARKLRRSAFRGRRTARVSCLDRSPGTSTMDVWRKADAVCFDVDSTVCIDEGLDELAAHLGAGEAVAEWTTKAMTGNVKFEDALKARLEIIQPSRQDLEDFLRTRASCLSPGVDLLVKKLQDKGVGVFLISGGFRQIIYPVADVLGVPHSHVFANNFLFQPESGEFAGFDEEEFTSRSGGKAAAIKHIKQAHGYQRLVMMGDGATDLEARQPGGADMFICYGGVVTRENVAKEADWFVDSFHPLIDALHA